MSQDYEDIPITEKVYNSLSTLLQRDETGVTASSGTEFPQNLNSKMVGRLCLRTDQKILYYLSKYDNGEVEWTKIIDFSQPLVTESYAEEHYQPLNSNLTALSNVPALSDTIPYFNTSTSMSTLPLNSFLRSLLNVTDAASTRTLLGLGNLATVDSITSSNSSDLIDDGSIPVSKFNFTPMTAGEGYTIGDVKESYNSTPEDDFLELNRGYTIGNDSSNATYRGSNYNSLYLKIWPLANVSCYTSDGSAASKGSSATVDWNANKRLSLPNGTNYINPNCYYRIKYK